VSTGKRAFVIYSPASGRAVQLQQALDTLHKAGIEIIETIPINDLPQKAAQGQNWIEQGAEIAIAAGGDGTIGSVINHIAGSALPLGIMPLGTSNDIARSLSIPLDLSHAARTIAADQIRMVDLGVARSLESKKSTDSTAQFYGYFAHVLTIGLNVRFAQIATNVATRKRYGRLTYPVAALEVLRNPEVLPVHLEFEGIHFPERAHQQQATNHQIEANATLSCRALQVTIVNAPIFGGAWQFTLPGSSLDDDVLDIVVFEEFGPGRLSARLASLFNSPPLDIAEPEENDAIGEFIRHPAELTGLPGMHHLQARNITITTEQDPQPITLDGEICGHTPLSVKLVKNALPVLAPININSKPTPQ
jgi:diacylglycerol kinase (ATP)